MLMVCENLEFHEGGFTSIEEILEMFNVDHKEKKNQSGMSRSSLGRIVKAFVLKELENAERNQRTVISIYEKSMVLLRISLILI